ncbi:hypothetical protein ElyMa_002482000 [Elysia marginata]|uniref:Uncharacterized protein n=1 Tax=Elysia marginata TaxID=1093978 RepID=A0AAV4GMR5_9GAST|nr:hypothetical protein ElyMa_002482000 [Elysia marginata]
MEEGRRRGEPKLDKDEDLGLSCACVSKRDITPTPLWTSDPSVSSFMAEETNHLFPSISSSCNNECRARRHFTSRNGSPCPVCINNH